MMTSLHSPALPVYATLGASTNDPSEVQQCVFDSSVGAYQRQHQFCTDTASAVIFSNIVAVIAFRSVVYFVVVRAMQGVCCVL